MIIPAKRGQFLVFGTTPGEVLFPNYPGLPRYSCWIDSQISTPARLIFVTHRDDSPAIPARRGRQPVTLVGGVGAAPAGSASSAGPPGASGDTARPNYVGPSGNGLVERMKAGAKNPAG